MAFYNRWSVTIKTVKLKSIINQEKIYAMKEKQIDEYVDWEDINTRPRSDSNTGALHASFRQI